MSHNTSNYNEQGGSRMVVGGSLDIASGGDLDIESGASLKIAGTAVTPSAAELNFLNGSLQAASFTIGSQAGDVINVGIQLEDGDGNDLAAIGAVLAYLSDDSAGDGVTATAPDGGVAIGTDGSVIAAITAGKVFLLQSESDGDIDLDITESSTGTWYLAVILPNGKLAVSGAITFA